MHQSYLSLHFVDIYFNLSRVDDSVWADRSEFESDLFQLALSTCQSFETLPKISVQPFCAPSSPISATQTSSIVRGRDAPFPIRPSPDRRITLSGASSFTSTNALLEKRYSTPNPTSDQKASDISSGEQDQPLPVNGHSSQPSRQPMAQLPSVRRRPTLTRNDSRLVYSAPETVDQEEDISGINGNEETHYVVPRQTSRNSTLLRVPPFPLPHRALQQYDSLSNSTNSDKDAGYIKERSKPISKRFSSIPPPLLLLDTDPWDRNQAPMSTEDSPVLGREEARRLLQLRQWQQHQRAEILQCVSPVAVCA